MEEGTMADLQVTTISGVDTVLKEAAVTAFKQSLRGQLIVTPFEARISNAELRLFAPRRSCKS